MPETTRSDDFPAVALQRSAEGCHARDIDQVTVQPARGATVTLLQALAGRPRCKG